MVGLLDGCRFVGTGVLMDGAGLAQVGRSVDVGYGVRPYVGTGVAVVGCGVGYGGGRSRRVGTAVPYVGTVVRRSGVAAKLGRFVGLTILVDGRVGDRVGN